MTLRMADADLNANFPPGMDAYAAYIDGHVGNQPNYDWIVTHYPTAKHLSISVLGNPADCADVENGAMTSWAGYNYGYCSISNAQTLIERYGRPKKLWTAHYTNTPHICSAICGFGFKGTADATQWTDHSGAWDESLLLDDFFTITPPPDPPTTEEEMSPIVCVIEDTHNAYLLLALTGAPGNEGLYLSWIGDPAYLTWASTKYGTQKVSDAYTAQLTKIGPQP